MKPKKKPHTTGKQILQENTALKKQRQRQDQDNKRPIARINDARGKRVIVICRDNRRYAGLMDGHDVHMNICLKDAELKIDGESTFTPLQCDVVVRGNRVLHVELPKK